MAEQAAYDVLSYDLDLRIDPDRRFLRGTVTVEVSAIVAFSWFVLDLDHRLGVTRVARWADGESESRVVLPYEQRGGKLWIALDRECQPGQRLIVAIDYAGHPRTAARAPWDGGFTWSETGDGQPWIATSVQGEGGDLWWPCKDHPSDKPDSVTIRATVPAPLVVASNGRLVEVLENADGTRTHHWHTSFPISNYNVALNIAPYETINGVYESLSGETVPVTFWVLPENKERGEKLFTEILDHLNFYERYLGPYPFRAEKYGVAETPHLGMEHQSIIAYGNLYRGGPHGYDWLHHHELGHEWWGNLVTVSDWRDFWIHEGLCTYMQALYAEEREGIVAYHHAMYESRRRIKNEFAVVPSLSTGMHAMFEGPSNDVYFKGSWILHMLRYQIGRERLIECLRRFAYASAEAEKTLDGSACRFVTTEDFIATVEEVTGREWDWFFDLFLRQPELPKLVCRVEGETLTLEWETPEGFPFPMPLEMEVDGEIIQVEMPEGRTELSAARFAHALIDPNLWLLKEPKTVNLRQISETSTP